MKEIFKNEEQKKNWSKYFYDISKIYFALTVVGPFAKAEITDKFTLLSGIVATLLFLFLPPLLTL